MTTQREFKSSTRMQVEKRVEINLWHNPKTGLWFFRIETDSGGHIAHHSTLLAYGTPWDCLTRAAQVCKQLKEQGDL